MPVVKVRNDNGVWENVAGASGHTHSVTDITNFPLSMPANGGNAETLGGMRASEFAHADDFIALENLVGNTNVATQIANATKRAMHKNLLDNSDFSKPVNQRGQTSYPSGNYCIDRWVCNANVKGTLTVENGYIKLSNSSSGFTDFYQIIEHYESMKGKRYTFAINCNGTTHIKVFTMGSAGSGYALGDSGLNFYSVANQHVLLRILDANVTANIYWAALYEGEYTEENLPTYQPKGYGAELAECQRYYIRIPSLSVASGHISNSCKSLYANFPIPTSFRIQPTATLTGSIAARNHNGHISEATWSAPLSGAVVSIDGCTPGAICIRFDKKDGSVWSNVANGTTIQVQLYINSHLELSADL